MQSSSIADRGYQRAQAFRVILVKPSHYDDDGYVIQWFRSPFRRTRWRRSTGWRGLRRAPRARARCRDRHHAFDETNTRIRLDRIAADDRRRRHSAWSMLVGVQSNQFPRALDIARPLARAGIPVGIGGFHVSGTIAMLAGVDRGSAGGARHGRLAVRRRGRRPARRGAARRRRGRAQAALQLT